MTSQDQLHHSKKSTRFWPHPQDQKHQLNWKGQLKFLSTQITMPGKRLLEHQLTFPDQRQLLYTMNPDSQELTRLAGVGPRTVSSTQVESMYKYSSDRKQFSAIPSKTIGMSVDAFTIPSHLWQGGGVGGGGNRRASITKKTAISK